MADSGILFPLILGVTMQQYPLSCVVCACMCVNVCVVDRWVGLSFIRKLKDLA